MKTSSKWILRALLVLLVITVTGAAAVLWLRHKNLADVAGTAVKTSLIVTSTSFTNGGRIPDKFACEKAISPALTWSEPPTGTQSIVIIMEDPDAPFGFIHWIVFGLPTVAHTIPEGASSHLAESAKQGQNSFGDVGYVGPCPPFGSHHYIFRVYAVDSSVNLPTGATKVRLTEAITGHVLAEGKIVGIYSRRK